MLTGVLCGGLAVLCGVGAHSATQSLSVINKEKNDQVSKMVTSTNLNSIGDGYALVQHTNTSAAGYVDVEVQRTVQELQYVPYHGTSFGSNGVSWQSGSATTYIPVTRFFPYRSYLTDQRFGLHNFTPSQGYVDHVGDMVRTTQQPSFAHASDGNCMTGALGEKFNINCPLSPIDLYRCKFYSVGQRQLYMAGNKQGNNFTFHRVALDPKTLVDNEFSHKSSKYETGQTLGIIGTIAFGALALACVL